MIRSRTARPTRDLQRSVEFYRDVLGLQLTGGFRGHDGYDGALFALPGGGELELTAGPAEPGPWSEDDLLVLYVADRVTLAAWAAALGTHGIHPEPAANPYWARTGHTILDPDGYRVVLAVPEPEPRPDVSIDWYQGRHEELRPMFELAEDSAAQLARYLELGQVLVARLDGTVVGHLQLVPTDNENEIELKNMAVLAAHQGSGIGRRLVADAVRRSARCGYTRMVVATATADTGNIRFYQRVGFRLTRVEADAFTPDTGYPNHPEPIFIDGIELRDRVWFDRALT